MLNEETYMQQGHYYLETRESRKKIFDYFRNSLEKGIQKGEERTIRHVLANLQGFLSGESLLINNPDLPNYHTLKNQKENIKKETLEFLKENLYTLYNSMIISKTAHTYRYGLYLLGRYLPEIPSLPAEDFTGFIFLLITTPYRDFSDYPQEKINLENLTAKIITRYDLVPLVEEMPKSSSFRKKMMEIKDKVTPIEEFYYVLLNQIYNQIKENQNYKEIPPDKFLPFIFTKKGWFIFKIIFKDELKNLYYKKPEYYKEIQQSLQEKLIWTKRFDDKEIRHIEWLFFKSANQTIEERYNSDLETFFKIIEPYQPLDLKSNLNLTMYISQSFKNLKVYHL